MPYFYDGHLKKQEKGTYQSCSVPFGQRPKDQKGDTNGFHYLYDVYTSDEPDTSFCITYEIIDTWQARKGKPGQPYLKAHMLGKTDQIVIAKGQPPLNKLGNPEYLHYYLGKRTGKNLKSLYMALYEPYMNHSDIESVTKRTVNNQPEFFGAGCMKVVLKTGYIDYLVHSIRCPEHISVDDGLTTDASMAFLRTHNGRPVYAFMSSGTYLCCQDRPIFTQAVANVTGHIVDFEKELADTYTIDIRVDSPMVAVEKLQGRFIHIETSVKGNAVYRIANAYHTKRQAVIRIVTEHSLIRGYANGRDDRDGYAYWFSKGARFEIRLGYERFFENDS